MSADIDDILFNLESAVDENRRDAIMRASRFNDPRIINALNNLASNDENVELRYHARRVVHTIKEKLGNDMAVGIGAAAGPRPPSMDADAMNAALRSPDPGTRIKAVTALTNSNVPNRDALVREVLEREKDGQVKAALASALVAMGKAAVPFLTQLLLESDPRVKANAIEAVEQIGDAESYVHIVPHLTDADNRVKVNAAQALNRFGKTKLIRCLDTMMESPNQAYRDSAVYALGMAKMAETVPILEKALKDSAEPVRHKAARALEVLAGAGVKRASDALVGFRASGGAGEETVEVNVGDLFNREGDPKLSPSDQLFDDTPENRVAELKRITKLRAFERVDEIVALLRKEKDENVKATILLTLGRLKSKKYVSLIKPLLKDKNTRIRASAIESLGMFDDPSLWMDLLPFLDDANNRCRANAIVALRRCPDADLDTPLKKMLESRDSLPKRSALYALMELRDERYMSHFLTALNDPSQEIRSLVLENIVILKAEGFKAAEELQRQAQSRGLKLPEASGIQRRGAAADAEMTGSLKKTITVNREIDKLLIRMVEKGASDLHISSKHRPMIRRDGEIMVLEGFAANDATAMKNLIWPIMAERQRKEFEDAHDVDFAYDIPDLARFRVNVFSDMHGLGAVLRQLPSQVPSVEKLALPKQVVELCYLPKGLVLVTGPTGSGKSTTLAALVGYINSHRSDHIITIEDPIEFVHPSRKCLVNQREVHQHTTSFARALRAALREDPDIVLVGEMRDLETTRTAIETAETGHLVFGTLHTNTAASTVDRIINQFPEETQAHIRLMLAESLKAVIAQTLVKKIGGGRVAVWEIMIVNSAIANLIREAKVFQIPSIIQTTRSLGNITQADSLIDWVKSGVIEPREAYYKAVDKVNFLDSCKRANIVVDIPSEELAKDKAARG